MGKSCWVILSPFSLNPGFGFWAFFATLSAPSKPIPGTLVLHESRCLLLTSSSVVQQPPDGHYSLKSQPPMLRLWHLQCQSATRFASATRFVVSSPSYSRENPLSSLWTSCQPSSPSGPESTAWYQALLMPYSVPPKKTGSRSWQPQKLFRSLHAYMCGHFSCETIALNSQLLRVPLLWKDKNQNKTIAIEPFPDWDIWTVYSRLVFILIL